MLTECRAVLTPDLSSPDVPGITLLAEVDAVITLFPACGYVRIARQVLCRLFPRRVGVLATHLIRAPVVRCGPRDH